MNGLDIDKPVAETRVVVAMSGGVDSSTVAGLMKSENYDVTGITLKLYDDAKNSIKTKQCCAGQDILDAKRVSQKLNIEHKLCKDKLIISYKPSEIKFNKILEALKLSDIKIKDLKINETRLEDVFLKLTKN